jgi:glutamate-1-semialdehyde 2,1-aminomutase
LTGFTASDRYRDKARLVIAGGVNSNVRLAGRSLCFTRASGAQLFDLDGNAYIDYALGMGPAILGHAPPEIISAVSDTLSRGQLYAGQHEAELELGRIIQSLVPAAELVRFGITGSEMVQAAMRVARAHTGRTKIVKFDGHYHGWFDNILTGARDTRESLEEFGESAAPPTPGQSLAALEDLLMVPWNDIDLLARCFLKHRSEIAAVLMEPMMCNAGAIVPRPGYLEAVRRLCLDHGAVLIFDEVITGFRLGLGGAQGRFMVQADLAVFAKAIGGGFPLAALTGRRELMNLIGSGAVNHSGTYNSNVVSTTAGLATLTVLARNNGQCLAQIERIGNSLIDGLRDLGRALSINLHVSGIGPVFSTSFGPRRDVVDYASFKQCDESKNQQFMNNLLVRGVRPTSRGTWFVSAAHTEADVDKTLLAAREALREVQAQKV